MMNGIGLDDSIPLLWAYDSESGSTMVGQPHNMLWGLFTNTRSNRVKITCDNDIMVTIQMRDL